MEPEAGQSTKNRVNPNRKQKCNQSVRCLYTNADVLTNKMTELKTVVDMERPEIVIVTEVIPKNRIDPVEEFEIGLDGYYMWHNLEESTNSSKTTRGIIIYLLNGLCANAVEIEEEFDEAVFLSMNLVKGDTLLLGALYRSPNTSSDANNENLCRLIEKLGPSSKYSHILLVGDLNYRNIDWESCSVIGHYPDDDNFLKATQNAYLFQHVNKPTRARGVHNSPSLIDLVLTNEENMVRNLRHLNPLGSSDHCVLSFDYVCYTCTKKSQSKLKFNYDKGNYENLKNDLDIDWVDFFAKTSCDINAMYDSFLKKITQAIEQNIPKCSIYNDQSIGKKINLPPAIKRQVQIKQRRWNRFLETRDPVKYRLYRKQTDYVKKLVKKARKDELKNMAKKIKGNPKRFWSYFNSKTQN